MTNSQKVHVAMTAPEVLRAVTILVALMQDIKAKNFVRTEYVFGDRKFALTLRDVTNQINPGNKKDKDDEG